MTEWTLIVDYIGRRPYDATIIFGRLDDPFMEYDWLPACNADDGIWKRKADGKLGWRAYATFYNNGLVWSNAAKELQCDFPHLRSLSWK